MNTESKILIGLAVGVVGVLGVWALSSKPATKSSGPANAATITPGSDGVVTLTNGMMGLLNARVGDTVKLSTGGLGQISSIDAEPSGVVDVSSVPATGVDSVALPVRAAGSTMLTVLWALGNTSFIAVQAS